MKRLKIDLADRSYEILIGQHLLQKTVTWVSEVVTPSRIVLITHPSIHRLYGQRLVSDFNAAGFPTDVIEVPEGETSKSLREAEKIYDRLLEWNCDRQSLLIALGGGVIGDLTGFIAATYVRGIPFIQIPTSLLAQVDSSVGGKTAVNHPRGKNMIGAFYQPKRVLIDLDTLKTLPEREFKAGLAEVIKYGVIEDAGLFRYLETNAEKILSHDTAALEHIISTSCAIKAKVVEKDERESHYRMVLNFGHTIGHAVEALTGYSSLVHGEAVAIGMVYAARLSQVAGKCSAEVPRRITSLIEKMGLPTQLPALKPEDMIESMYHDKKTSNKKIRFILVKDIGSIEIVDQVAEPLILEALQN